MTTPEQKAREQIDHQFEHAGWIVRDMVDFNFSKPLSVAVCEFPMKEG